MTRQLELGFQAAPDRIEEASDVTRLEVVGVLDRDPRWDRRLGGRRCEVISSELLD